MGRGGIAAALLLPIAALLFLAGCEAGQFSTAPEVEEEAVPLPTTTVAAAEGWQAGAAMPTARSEMRVAVVDGVFYVPGGFGGLTSFEAYDTDGDSWTTLAPMLEPAHHMMATGHGGKVYVLGGARSMAWQATPTVFVYTPATGEWTQSGPMPERRMSGEAVSLGDYIYLVGGTGGTTAMLRYEPDTETWNLHPGPSQPREHVAAVAYGGEIWVIGGRLGRDGRAGDGRDFRSR